MKTVSWNCRGLGNPGIVRALVKVLHQEKPDIVFLMETKKTTTEMRRLNEQKLRYKGCIAVDCEVTTRSRRGGVCMMWGEHINLHLISFSLHHIMCKVEGEERGDWICSGKYGWPQTEDRCKTWMLLEQISWDAQGPWVCIGDFNEILWHKEKVGGNRKKEDQMARFREALIRCKLDDLGYVGFPFTWSNGRVGTDHIQERLDRAAANEEWRTMFPTSQVFHLP